MSDFDQSFETWMQSAIEDYCEEFKETQTIPSFEDWLDFQC